MLVKLITLDLFKSGTGDDVVFDAALDGMRNVLPMEYRHLYPGADVIGYIVRVERAVWHWNHVKKIRCTGGLCDDRIVLDVRVDGVRNRLYYGWAGAL